MSDQDAIDWIVDTAEFGRIAQAGDEGEVYKFDQDGKLIRHVVRVPTSDGSASA
jgi:hypothetical protein